MAQADYCPEKKNRFEEFFRRLDPLRKLRNHIAHGIMRTAIAPDQKTFVQTLSVPRDLDDSDSPDARHMGFDELLATLSTLNELIEDFQRLAGFKVAISGTIVPGA